MHLSDVKKFIRCEKLYQNSLVSDTNVIPFLNIHIDVCESIKAKLQIENYQIGLPNQTNSDTEDLLQKTNWLFRARFEYNELRVKIPLVHKNQDQLDLYFISYSISENLDESINIHPTTNHIYDEYMDSSIFAFSSRYEGFGLVLIEGRFY